MEGAYIEATKPSIDLPAEILVQVFSNLSQTKNPQTSLHSCTLVSRLWYSVAVESLYNTPVISGKNFQLFVNTICPSVNTYVKKSGYSDLVRRLDMSPLIDEGSKSLTARILGRCTRRLEEFVASRASFAVNCLAALSTCSNLRRLDLSWISEALDLSAFFTAINKLEKLECLHFPRTSQIGKGAAQRAALWPANLRELHISGYFNHKSPAFFSNFPPSLTKLNIKDNHRLPVSCILLLVKKLGRQLKFLKIGNPIETSELLDLADILPHLHVLRQLSISADSVITKTLVEYSTPELAYNSSVVELQLNAHCMTHPTFLWIIFRRLRDAVLDGRLGRLRKVKVHQKLIMHGDTCEPVGELDILLERLARRDEVALGSSERIGRGVWIFGKRVD